MLFTIKFDHLCCFERVGQNLEYCKDKHKRKYGRNRKGFYLRYKKKQILSQKLIEEEIMEEMKLGHKGTQINNVVDLKVELCACLCVKCNMDGFDYVRM